MTALNKTIRQQIINSVIEKGTTIPARKDDLTKRTEQRVRELCLERVPKDFAAATRNLPRGWFPHHTSEHMPPHVCPTGILAHMDDDYEMRRQWRHTVSFEPFPHPYNTRFDRSPTLNQGMDDSTEPPTRKPDDLESWEARLADLIEEAKRIAADENKARTKLRQFLASVNSYKRVLEKMPELEPHLPNYTKPMPLVVSVAPILETLGALGFDQTSTQEAA